MSGFSFIMRALYALAMTVALVSCEKAIMAVDSTTSGDKNGNLRVSVYQIEQTPFTSITRRADNATTRAAQNASKACTRLNFAIYDEGGSRLKQVNQTSDKASFGQCAFQLEEGTYQLVVVGHSASSNPTMDDWGSVFSSFGRSERYCADFHTFSGKPGPSWEKTRTILSRSSSSALAAA